MSKIVPVILSGGSGTRLWPLSTDERPKQFLALAGSRSMFAETLARCGDAAHFAQPLIVGAERHATLMEAEVAASGARIILEPCARNTAPAIALAALAVEHGEAVMLVMPSDHVIGDLPAFLAAVETALPAARSGALVTFGIRPTGPETGFGYIRMADGLPGAPGVCQVEGFIEKPARDVAEAMLAQGGHAWNAGIFLMRADRYLEELARHAPDMHAACRAAMEGAKVEGRLVRPDAGRFAASSSESVDYAVMERSARVAVVPVSCGWSDVGSWDALAALGEGDAEGNRIAGDVIALDSANSLIRADGITVAVSGVHDLIIVANGTHVMIVPRGRSQDVKAIVEALKSRNTGPA